MRKEKKRANKAFGVLICIIYTMIYIFFCIDYLDFQSKKLSEISVDDKYLVKYFNKLLYIVISYLLMNLFSFHGFTKNIKYIVVLNFPKRMLEYFFSKRCGIF